MKRFSFAPFAVLLGLVVTLPAFAQVTYVRSGDNLGKRINIGANPVCSAGYPADSLTAHSGWEIHAFDFPISIRCADRNGKVIEGYVEKFEPLVVSVLSDGPTETVYMIHVVQRCGNPVFNRWVSIPKSPPPRAAPEVTRPTLPKPPLPTPREPVVVTKKGGGGIPFDAWFGVAASKSVESRAFDSFEGLYLDFPLTVDGWTFKLAGASSQSNFDKFRGGVTHHRAYAGNISRLQTGLSYRPWNSVRLQGLIGVQYDHKVDGWQPGPLLEGYAGFPVGPIWNEENATYQTGTEAFWFRTRHRVPILKRGATVWSLGGEFLRNAYRDNPGGVFYRYYTTRAHGFLHLETSWLGGVPCIALAGFGRGSDSEKWGFIVEAGTRLW